MKTLGQIMLTPTSSKRASNDSIQVSVPETKSSSNLAQTSDKSIKFRETTYFPATTKNKARESLRCTINEVRVSGNIVGPQLSPLQGLKLKRKMTVPDEVDHSFTGSEMSNNYQMFSSIRKIQKKNSNPEGKEEQIVKQVPKFLEKKIMDLATKTNNKTERVNVNEGISLTPKKNFFSNVNKETDERPTMCKNISTYSASNLKRLKNKHSLPSDMGIGDIDFGGKGTKMEDFKKLKYLGEGRFGQVYLVLHKKTNSIFALKQISKESIKNNKMEEQFMTEIKMQSFFNHPNILKLYGFFDDSENVYLILEYMLDGTLYSEVKKNKKLNEKEASLKMKDVIEGVKYLHSLTIAHRDIKPENIVISCGVCKICDFGWAAECSDRRKTMCGTIDYASPELLQGKEYGIAIDLWCLGVLCYELVVGKCPFYHISQKETMKRIINADTSEINIPNTLSLESRDFINRLIVSNPEERMSADLALRHIFITRHNEDENA